MVHHRRTHTVCVSLVYSTIILSMIILWGGQVECRICKWKLLSVDRTFVAAFALLTSFRDVGSSFHILLQQTECK